MSGLLSTLVIVGALFVGWQVATGKMPEVESAVKDILSQIGLSGGLGKLGGAVGVGGGTGNLSAGKGGLIMKSAGKTWKAVDSGKTTRNYASGGSSGTTQWDIKNVGPITNLEVTVFVNVGSCGDEVSLKVFGPSHSGSNCCWLIMNVDCNTGRFQLGGEGPHPDTNKTNLGTGQSIGSLKNKEVGIKLVVYKSGSQYTAIGYAYVGSSWKEMLRKSFASWGDKKKSSTPHASATIQFRTDCNGVKYSVAEAAAIMPGVASTGAGGISPLAEVGDPGTEGKKTKSNVTFINNDHYVTAYPTYIQRRQPTVLENLIQVILNPPGIHYPVPIVA